MSEKLPPKTDWAIERTLSGFLVIATTYKNRRVSQKYVGYTRRLAEQLFRQHLMSL
jgi:hypothetical protein